MYNIGFNLGDPFNEGHGMTKTFHIQANHSVEEITEAYKKASKKLGWNYLTTICDEYDDSSINLEQIEDIEKKLNISIKESLSKWQKEDLEHDEYCYLDTVNFVDIFFAIVSSEIPDFKWNEIDFNEHTLYLLDGAGYGLFSH